MKITYKLLAGLLTIMVLQTTVSFSQDKTEENQPSIIVVTKAHWNYDREEGSNKDWLAIEKEYFDKITMKNEYILHTNVLMHMFTEDNSEVLFIRTFKSWDDIEKASIRDNELAEEAWPDKEERSAFFKKQGNYYSSKHSDEIYQGMEGAKFIDDTDNLKDPLIYYKRINHLAFPENAEPGEIQKLYDEYTTNITHKLTKVLAYYPYRHLYGADSREFVEVFVVKSFADIEGALDETFELVKTYWPDEEKRKEFFTKYDKYFSPWHGDFIYTNVPGLMK